MANLILEQMKEFFLATLHIAKHTNATIKRLGRIVDSIDVVVDEKGYIPRQVHHEDIEEDEGYPQRQNDEEKES